MCVFTAGVCSRSRWEEAGTRELDGWEDDIFTHTAEHTPLNTQMLIKPPVGSVNITSLSLTRA